MQSNDALQSRRLQRARQPHRHPLPLFDLASSVPHFVQVPVSYGAAARYDFVLDPIRQAVMAGLSVVYVDWSRRSQRWGDVLNVTGGDPLLGTLARREQPRQARSGGDLARHFRPRRGARSFEMLPAADEMLGMTALRAVQRHRDLTGACYVVLDATQPGPGNVPPPATDLAVTGMEVEQFALLAAEVVVHVSVETPKRERESSARYRAEQRWGMG